MSWHGDGPDLPAPADVVACCWDSVNSGGERCSCWEPVLVVIDPDPALVDQQFEQEGPPHPRRQACHDCAYRAGSPERTAQGGALPDYTVRDRFYCHDGMPVVVAWTHPSGAIHRLPLAETADYHPRARGDRAWRIDGRPGLLCAGWAAVNGIDRPRPAALPPAEPA